MSNIYGTAKVCPYTKRSCSLATEGLALEPGSNEIMSYFEFTVIEKIFAYIM